MWRERLGVVTSQVAVAVLFAGLAWVAFRLARQPGDFSLCREECARGYRLARTETDTAIVDLRRPAAGPGRAPNAPTCGVLRRLHRRP